MNRMKLLLEDLCVESFAVEPEFRGAGTVRGLEIEGTGVHSQCATHCATDCEDCNSVKVTYCVRDCPTLEVDCSGCEECTLGWDCGGTIEA
jgi:hypothetical protein